MNGKYFWGIILVLIGGGFLLEQFDIITFGDMFRVYWPSLLILLGLVGLFDRGSSKTGNLILIVIGGLIQIDKLDLLDINVYKLIWPIILILVGLSVIFSKNGFVEVRTNFNMDGSKGKKKMNNITLEDTIDAFTMMGAIETNNQSQEFKGGKATVVMGGIDLDLRDAVLYNNEAFLELNVIMGGIEIYVPSDWRVEVTGVPLLGAWENKARNNTDPNAPILKIKCFILMGGIDVN
ncbi:LiaF transmembrane domain-containing protein [Tissierella sp.]|uniref:LiaF transmembrane domain-containing protein n=1 Tax=Tissierella sp. TaxID=41274 RepID=UPI00286251B9|nr:DUF5668 domain-containing protein [Tissierella sp.]MDR7856676.1 DUF5668 domain-containing protein [Tissierella sp.]